MRLTGADGTASRHDVQPPVRPCFFSLPMPFEGATGAEQGERVSSERVAAAAISTPRGGPTASSSAPTALPLVTALPRALLMGS